MTRALAWPFATLFLQVALLGSTLAGCDPGGPSVEQVDRAQPGATVLPLQSANLFPADGGLPVRGDAGATADASPPAPTPFEAYDQPAADRLGRELEGVRLRARWRQENDGPWPEPPEGVRKRIEELRKATATEWVIELAAAGRLRIETSNRGQPLPVGAALLKRHDRFGSVLLWPNGSRYRLLPSGTLRNVLSDRRADVSPLTVGRIGRGRQSERLGRTTTTVKLESNIAVIELELAEVAAAGLGATLLCRTVVEIGGIEPSTEVCASELVLRARIDWVNPKGEGDSGGLELVVLEIDEDPKLDSRRLSVPPPRARFMTSGLPGSPRAVFLTERELGEMRSEPAPSAPATDPPMQGLTAINRSDRLLFLVLDGVVVASVPAWQSMVLSTLPAGSYQAQWRAFLGDVIEPAAAVTVPSEWTYGEDEPEKPDAG